MRMIRQRVIVHFLCLMPQKTKNTAVRGSRPGAIASRVVCSWTVLSPKVQASGVLTFTMLADRAPIMNMPTMEAQSMILLMMPPERIFWMDSLPSL